MEALNLHILNGCTSIATHTCTTSQQGRTTMCITVDYIIANDTALERISKIMVEYYPPCTNSKNLYLLILI